MPLKKSESLWHIFWYFIFLYGMIFVHKNCLEVFYISNDVWYKINFHKMLDTDHIL